MYCTKCGNEMADEALFCPYCGTRRFLAPEPLTSEPSPGEAAAPEPITAVEMPEAERPAHIDEPQPVTAHRRSLGRGLLAGLGCLLLAALVAGGIWVLLRLNRPDARLYRAASESLSELERYVEDLPNLRTIVKNLRDLEPQTALRLRMEVTKGSDEDWLESQLDFGKFSLEYDIDSSNGRSMLTGTIAYQSETGGMEIPIGIYIDKEQIQFASTALLEEGEALAVPNKGFAEEWNRSVFALALGITMPEEELPTETDMQAALETLYGEDWKKLHDSFQVEEQKDSSRFSGSGTTYVLRWDRDLLHSLREKTGDEFAELFDYDEEDIERLLRLNSSEINAKLLILFLSELSDDLSDPLAYVEDGQLRAVVFTGGEDNPREVEIRLMGEENAWEHILITTTRERYGKTVTKSAELQLRKSDGKLFLDVTETDSEDDVQTEVLTYRDSDGAITVGDAYEEQLDGCLYLTPEEDGVQLRYAKTEGSDSGYSLFVSGKLGRIQPFTNTPIEVLKLNLADLKELAERAANKLLLLKD